MDRYGWRTRSTDDLAHRPCYGASRRPSRSPAAWKTLSWARGRLGGRPRDHRCRRGKRRRRGTVGVLTACEGVFGFLQTGRSRGRAAAVAARAKLAGPLPNNGVVNATVAGKPVRLLFGCSDDTAEHSLRSPAPRGARGVDILIGPTQIAEAIAIHDYAKRQPNVTFVNGTASGQSLTLLDPVPNVHSFALEGAQAMAGAVPMPSTSWVGAMSSRSVTTRPSTTRRRPAFSRSSARSRGTVGKRIWVPLSTQDYALMWRRCHARE